MDLSKIPCQEITGESLTIPGIPIICGRPGAMVIFHQRDGRNVYVMCEVCGSHSVKNRRAEQLVVIDPNWMDIRLHHAGCIGLLESCSARISRHGSENSELQDNLDRCFRDFVNLRGGKVVRTLDRIAWEPE